MGKHSTTRVIADEVIGKTADGWDTHLLTTVHYGKGGTNWASGNHEPRGYYLSVRIEDTQTEGGVTLSRTLMFSGGIKTFIEPAKMFSAKRLSLVTVDEARVSELRAKVLAQHQERDEKARANEARHASA